MPEGPAPAPKPIDVAVARRAALEFTNTAALPAHQQELVRSLRDKSRINPETALQMMAGRTTPDRAVALLFTDGQIGPDTYNLNPTTGFKDRTSPTAGATPAELHEVRRATEMNSRINEAYDYVENGTITPRARAEVLRALYRDPGVRAALEQVYPGIDAVFPGYMANPGTIPAGIANSMDEILRNREYSGEMQRVISEAIQADVELDNETKPIRMRVQDLNQDIADITTELNDPTNPNNLTLKLGSITTQLTQFDRTLGGGGIPLGLQAQALTTLGGTIATAETQVRTLESQLRIAQGVLTSEQQNTTWDATIRRNVPNNPAAIAAAHTDIANAEASLGTYRSTLADAQSRRQELLNREQELQRQQKELQDNITAKRKELREKEKELREEQGKLAPHDRKRRQKELEFIDKVNGLFANATDGYMNARMQRVGESYNEVAGKQMKTEMEEIEQQLRDAEMTRWFRNKRVGVPVVPSRLMPRDWRRRNVPEISRAAVDADFDNLLRNGGNTRTLMNDLMGANIDARIRTKHGVAAGTPLTVAQQREATEMLDKLNQDHGNELTDKLMQYKFRNGKIRKEEAIRIQMSPLGIGFIQRNWDKNTALKQEIETLAGAGAIDKLSTLPKKKIAAISALILLFLATGSVVATKGISGSVSII